MPLSVKALALQEVMSYAGALALDYINNLDQLEFHQKKPRDLVSEADLAVEKQLIESLTPLAPGAGFFGEETGHSDNQKLRWIIDPIDGTHSFVRGQYFWGLSVALERDGELELAAVYAPKLGDLYLAEKGKGAYKNGEPIHCSKTADLSEAMISTGFACLRAGLADNNLPRFGRIALATMGHRRFGSAALDLCLVADGQVDLFWEQELNLYDVAAGVLIAKEAGASITNFAGEDRLDPKQLLATNGLLTAQVLPLM
ncbi:MAG: inositol monophosphatase family protein [bacterium]|nr:inositol monophosphatase family protein [bacterium]